MSSLSSFFPGRFLGSSAGSRSTDRSDALSHLRQALEGMPAARKYSFTPSARAEVLSELYDALWGSYAHMFLPNSTSSIPMNVMLSSYQVSTGFMGAGKQSPIVPGRPCGQILKRGESCFRCKDCAGDDSCVLCSRCFHATDHTGHNVSFFIAQQSGGCCDCGDREAWRQPISCPFHPPAAADSLPMPLTAFHTLPPPVKDYPYRVAVPSDLREAMGKTIGYALDFVLATFDISPDEPSIPPSEAELRLQPTADPMTKDQYSVVLWNDDKHSFDETIKLLCDLTNRTREEASVVAHRIDLDGRDIIESDEDVPRLLEITQALAQIDLGVTIRRSYDTFREQVAAVIIEWLRDLTQSRMGTDTIILREIIAEELLSARKIPSPNSIAREIINPCRIDYFFLYHTKLWKRPRLSLKEIYTTALTLSRQHKLAVAGHFANVYGRVIDAYLLMDREAETSIKYFALQLFTVPSVAGHIVRNHQLVSRLLSIITSFFTNQIEEKKHIRYPPSSSANHHVDVDAFPFKSKRFMPVFSDLRYLCNNEPVQTMIARNRDFLAQFVKTCRLFMCINPNKRAARNHVEYETDAWISVFNVTLSLSRVIKVYGEAYSRATPEHLVAGIKSVAHHILLTCAPTDATSGLDRTKFGSIAFHNVEFGGLDYRTVEFDVLEGWVSFHHSLHWLLAELFKHTDILSFESMQSLGVSRGIQEILLADNGKYATLIIIDFPLRVLAMVAQIRTGLWVRNGFAIRGQLLHYRDFMLRELCYDQDLFMMQIALALLDPDTVLVSILERFGLLEYFSGAIEHSTYEGAQLAGMVEEVLYVFITILSEDANASKMSTERQVRREIVHALALGPCSYTDLVKRVAERLVEDVCFESVLRSIALFKPPESTTDSGTYELKDEMFDEVNPFFYHYTRNKREEIEGILLNRLKKRGVTDPVIVPRPTSIPSGGPFSDIVSSCFDSKVLLQILFYPLHHILAIAEQSQEADSFDAILDQTLHLIMLAIVERGSVFAHLSVTISFEGEKVLADLLCRIEWHEKYAKVYRLRVAWILDQISLHVSEEISTRRKTSDDSVQPVNSEELKKIAAKARQEAIMLKMKAQQASFASFNFDEDDEADDDEDMEPGESGEPPHSHGTCIVCQEDLDGSRPFGMLGMVQPSRQVRRQPDGSNVHLNDVLSAPASMDRGDPIIGMVSTRTFPPPEAEAFDIQAAQSPNHAQLDGFPPGYTRFGLHASACSHIMHLDCFHNYSTSIRQRHRAQATRNHPEVIPRKEYICPLCKSLGNVIFPLPEHQERDVKLSEVPFSDWIRAAGISILKSKADPLLESLQFRNGTGEFVFWSAQDSAYSVALRGAGGETVEVNKMVDTVMVMSKAISHQTRHLRDRFEPEPGERGAGLYLPEELVGYTISAMEASQRGTELRKGRLVVDNITDAQTNMVRGLVICLTRLSALHFRPRPDEGREAVRQAIIKRLLPEWSRGSLTSFSYPLLLRDPFTLLVETAAIAPDMLRHVLILTYYACLARTVIGLVFVLNKIRSHTTNPVHARSYEHLFGDVRMFFMSVVRHSPVFEHTATLAFETFGEGRIEKLIYAFTLPFLRKAAILCRSVIPDAFTTDPNMDDSATEYKRLLTFLGIPPLQNLPGLDTLQNALSGWCAHYGHSHAASPLSFGVSLDMPGIYRLVRLPLILDNLFSEERRCTRCGTTPVDAAICLICGTTVCFQSDCCVDVDGYGGYERRGECNMHMRECAGAIGIYFLLKRCQVVYLYANNGTFWQSPYLDVHGEVDISMRRGRRQFLHHARWEDIRKMWLNHQIPTLIARKLESSVDSGGWETF